MSALKEKIAKLTLDGLTDALIAAKCGVTPGYISQIKSDQQYQRIHSELAAATRVAKHETYVAIDDNWDSLELTYTQALRENAATLIASLATKPRELINLGRLLNSAKRRASGETSPTHRVGDLVELEVPAFMLQAAMSDFGARHNSQNEIVEVAGRTLLAMPSDQLRAASAPALDAPQSVQSEISYIKEERPSVGEVMAANMPQNMDFDFPI